MKNSKKETKMRKKPEVSVSAKATPLALTNYDKLVITIKVSEINIDITQIEKVNNKLLKIVKREFNAE